MARIKVSDLVEVIDRNIPLLVYVDPPQLGRWNTDEPKLPVLHISTQIGQEHSHGARHNITQCNRALLYVNVYHYGIIDIKRFRLCAICAKEQVSFDNVLIEHHRLRAELAQKRKEQQAQKELEQQREREALQARLTTFANEFFNELPVELDGHKLHAEYNGRLYEIREVTK